MLIEKDTDNRYTEHHMNNAINAAAMSYSNKRKVGCVIVKDNRTIVSGWNGRLPNHPNACEYVQITCGCNGVEYEYPDKPNDSIYGEPTTCDDCGELKDYTFKARDDVLHAEENAILYAARDGISIIGTSLYTTTAPCIRCARMIVASGISKVRYLDSYKNTEGVNLIRRSGVDISMVVIPKV